jgi:hypothetical protein
MRQYSQNNVKNDANAVIATCSKLETDTSRARNELSTVIRGLATAIDGYIRLEKEFA